MARLVYYITRKTLEVQGGGVCFNMSATSGKGGCMNRVDCISRAWAGPIPPGAYSLYSRDISDPGSFGDRVRNMLGDWGDWRVPLLPAPGTPTFGRSGFFLHGGSTPGSAGCIDIGGGVSGDAATDRLLAVLKEANVSQLLVRK